MFNQMGRVCRTKFTKIRFEEEIDWSLKHLKKEDRIVWYLSIIQRYALLRFRDKDCQRAEKLEKKISQKVKKFGRNRIQEDFENFDKEKWCHLHDFQEVTQNFEMKNFSFYLEEKQGVVSPKKSSLVLEEFSRLEKLAHGQTGDRFCSDGNPFIEFSDGWKWFEVKNGYSRQEALAMRHCGNGVGGNGDTLYSLREPVYFNKNNLWKPHLTFIVNRGFIGESKGYANQKPNPKYHPYIERLLCHESIWGIHGGGYLPKSNFNFFDLSDHSQGNVLRKKPKFEYDLVKGMGEPFLAWGSRAEWRQFQSYNMSKKASQVFVPFKNFLGGKWLVLKRKLSINCEMHSQSLAWGKFKSGQLSGFHFESEDIPSESITRLLLDSRITKISENLLCDKFGFGQFLNGDEIKQIMLKKPAFFCGQELDVIFQHVGNSEAFSSVLNYRYGLNSHSKKNRIILETYDSIDEFISKSEVTSISRSLKKMNHNETSVRAYDFFDLPWLRLERLKREPDASILGLVLNPEYADHFFKILDERLLDSKASLVQAIHYHFGFIGKPHLILD